MRRSFNNLSQIFNFNVTELFNTTIIQRGTIYYKNGYVTNIHYQDSEHLVANVIGTKMYTVTMSVDSGVLKMNCTCPCEGDCKHMVATFLKAKSLGNEIETTNDKKQEKKKKEHNIALYLADFRRNINLKVNYAGKIFAGNVNKTIQLINEQLELLDDVNNYCSTEDSADFYAESLNIILGISLATSRKEFIETVNNFINYGVTIFNKDPSILLQQVKKMIDKKAYYTALNILLVTISRDNNVDKSILTQQYDLLLKVNHYIGAFPSTTDAKITIALYNLKFCLEGKLQAYDYMREHIRTNAIRKYFYDELYENKEYEYLVNTVLQADLTPNIDEYIKAIDAAKKLNLEKETFQLAYNIFKSQPTFEVYSILSDLISDGNRKELFNSIKGKILEEIEYEDYEKIFALEGVTVDPFEKIRRSGFSAVQKNRDKFKYNHDFEINEMYFEKLDGLIYEAGYRSYREKNEKLSEMVKLLNEVKEIPNCEFVFANLFIKQSYFHRCDEAKDIILKFMSEFDYRR